MSEKLPSATSLKTAASRVVLAAYARAGRVSLSTKGKIRLHAPSGRTTGVPLMVVLAS